MANFRKEIVLRPVVINVPARKLKKAAQKRNVAAMLHPAPAQAQELSKEDDVVFRRSSSLQFNRPKNPKLDEFVEFLSSNYNDVSNTKDW